jgi:CRISPR-associated protein Cmr3
MRKILIKLTPLGSFFFGGEQSFAIGNNEQYIVKSRQYPQQSALLGMLRMLLLDAYGELNTLQSEISLSKKATNIIGEKSFDPTTKGKGNFAQIDSIGHICICKDNIFYYNLPDTEGLSFEDTSCRVAGNHGVYQKDKLPFIGFDAKKGLTEKFYGTDSTKIENKVFTERNQVGITKKIAQDDDEKGFYRQVSYLLEKEFSFAFEATLSEEAIVKIKERLIKNPIVMLGAERSCFNMELSETEIKSLKITTLKNAFYLLSDAFIDNSLQSVADFIIGESVPFRSLKTETEKTSNFYNRGKGGSNVDRSKRYNLLSKGSILFFDTDEQKEKIIEILSKKHPNFSQIGYNQFIIA